jgi:hypothetical protein
MRLPGGDMTQHDEGKGTPPPDYFIWIYFLIRYHPNKARSLYVGEHGMIGVCVPLVTG